MDRQKISKIIVKSSVCQNVRMFYMHYFEHNGLISKNVMRTSVWSFDSFSNWLLGGTFGLCVENTYFKNISI